MELPPEIVGIIREFSKPLFTYAKEYKEVLAIERVYRWPELEKKLYKKELLPLVKKYLECAKKKKKLEGGLLCSKHFNASVEFGETRSDLIIAVFDGNPRWDWSWEHSTWLNKALEDDDDDDDDE
jgi:hypothetical protein